MAEKGHVGLTRITQKTRGGARPKHQVIDLPYFEGNENERRTEFIGNGKSKTNFSKSFPIEQVEEGRSSKGKNVSLNCRRGN